MISPVSVPTLNEDPRVDTEIRPMYMFTSIANDFATNGGKYQVVAVQARAAITDRIGFIATKDGYVFLDPKDAVPDHSGLGQRRLRLQGLGGGTRDTASIVSLGLRYEAPMATSASSWATATAC